MAGDQDKNSALRCSFCGKTQDEVKKLVAGPTVYICNECVALCNNILKEEDKAETKGAPKPKLVGSQAGGDQGGAGAIRDRPGKGEKSPVGGGP